MGALFLACALAGGCGGGGIVARVNGSVVSEGEVQHWMGALAAANGGSGGSEKDLRGRTIDFLIYARWLTGEARELGLGMPVAEARRQLQLLRIDESEGLRYARLPKEAQLSRLLLFPKLGATDRMWLMTLSVLSSQVEHAEAVRAQREVPRGEVVRYYARHRREFLVPDARDLEIVGAPQLSVVMQAKREIEAGVPFLQVAHLRSSDGEAPEGLWHLVRGRDEWQIEDKVFPAKVGVLVGPEKFSLYYIFKVLRVLPEHEQTLAQVEAGIRRRLALAAGSAQPSAALEARWLARTSCSPGTGATRCHRRA